jgi:phage N-6-adenine-methyltransferase
MNKNLMFSSANSNWETPPEVFKYWDNIYHFNLDVAAVSTNSLCKKFLNDGLNTDWIAIGNKCWMNPPYGREIGKWVKKAFEEAKRGATVVCLLPARTDTRWFHDYCRYGDIYFIKGRIKFLENGILKGPAPFPSMVVVFKPEAFDPLDSYEVGVEFILPYKT